MNHRPSPTCASLERLSHAVAALPLRQRPQLMRNVLTFLPSQTLDESMVLGEVRSTLADYWESTFGGAFPVTELRSILEPPIPVETVMGFSRLGFSVTEAEIVDAVRELMAHLRRRLTTEFGAKQLHLLEAPSPSGPAEKCCHSVGETVTSLHELVRSGKRFGTIYADPPWAYENKASRAAADNHYVTMSVEQICSEPVRQLVEDNAHLHLWTTSGFLPDAFDVIKAWGFEYKSSFVWLKDEIGMGNYWRVSHEFLLLGVRGRLRFSDRTLRSWIQARRTSHSRKPGKVRQLIESAGTGPYLELYGREELRDSAWTVYGNQVERRLF